MGCYALLIGVSQFTDPKLGQLNAPCSDVEAFARVLKDAERGGFTSVITCIDQELHIIRDHLASLLLRERNPDDLVLLYYSGHGIVTKGQRLFLATRQSQFDYPQAASLSAAEIRDWLEQSRAAKQVVILDCCHSGAFGEGAKGSVQAVNPDTFGDGEGQYILTATDALQFAYDSSGVLKEASAPPALSRFTGWLVDAIDKGEAAPDSDCVTLDALFNYLSRRSRIEAVGMTPKRFVKRNSGEMVIARNPLAMPAQLPQEIISGLDAKDWQIRRDAVTKLGKLADQPRYRELAEHAITDRFSMERDRVVQPAMKALLLKLGSDTPAEYIPVEQPASGSPRNEAPAESNPTGPSAPGLARHDAPPPGQTPPIQHPASNVGRANRLANVAVTESASAAGLAKPSAALSILAVLLAVPILPVLYPMVGITVLIYCGLFYLWAQYFGIFAKDLIFFGLVGMLYFAIAVAVLHRELKFAETHPLYAKIRHWIRLTIIAGGTYFLDQTGSPGERAILAIALAVAMHFVIRYAAARRAWGDIVETAWTAIKDKERSTSVEQRSNTNL